jgi:hypothetical protein
LRERCRVLDIICKQTREISHQLEMSIGERSQECPKHDGLSNRRKLTLSQMGRGLQVGECRVTWSVTVILDDNGVFMS